VVVAADGAACPAKGSEVVMIGDSYFALSESASVPTGEITAHLESIATAAGALASGDGYRYYYASGANMATTYTNSTITPIPTQFANAVAANPDIKYVIMDGGGNDILLENTDCILASPDAGISAACETAVENAIGAATALFQTMKAAGVEKVIYFFYPNLPTTHDPSVNVILDYAFPLVQAACASAPLPCDFIDTRPAFAGKDATYIGPDNIHPTTAGSDVIGGLIWNEMQSQCVALSP
jgi:phospholipase/lecithinase/hemolysin